jgi:hypothetical protein
MLDNKDWQIVRDLRADLKFKHLEQIFKDYFKEAISEWKEEQKKQDEPAKPLMTIMDLAKRYKITKATVHNWINRGIITGNKVGKNRYFTEEEARTALTKYGFTKQWENYIED